jgi:hypothetical protein
MEAHSHDVFQLASTGEWLSSRDMAVFSLTCRLGQELVCGWWNWNLPQRTTSPSACQMSIDWRTFTLRMRALSPARRVISQSWVMENLVARGVWSWEEYFLCVKIPLERFAVLFAPGSVFLGTQVLLTYAPQWRELDLLGWYLHACRPTVLVVAVAVACLCPDVLPLEEIVFWDNTSTNRQVLLSMPSSIFRNPAQLQEVARAHADGASQLSFMLRVVPERLLGVFVCGKSHLCPLPYTPGVSGLLLLSYLSTWSTAHLMLFGFHCDWASTLIPSGLVTWEQLRTFAAYPAALAKTQCVPTSTLVGWLERKAVDWNRLTQAPYWALEVVATCARSIGLDSLVRPDGTQVLTLLLDMVHVSCGDGWPSTGRTDEARVDGYASACDAMTYFWRRRPVTQSPSPLGLLPIVRPGMLSTPGRTLPYVDMGALALYSQSIFWQRK